MNLYRFCISILVMCAFSRNAMSSDMEIAIVVAKDSSIESITKRELVDVFMGRFDVLESGQKVQPVDYENGSSLRSSFYNTLVNKNERQINAYWSRLIFSGRAKPPVRVSSPEEIFDFIVNNPSAVCYVPLQHVSEEMKIVLVLE